MVIELKGHSMLAFLFPASVEGGSDSIWNLGFLFFLACSLCLTVGTPPDAEPRAWSQEVVALFYTSGLLADSTHDPSGLLPPPVFGPIDRAASTNCRYIQSSTYPSETPLGARWRDDICVLRRPNVPSWCR